MKKSLGVFLTLSIAFLLIWFMGLDSFFSVEETVLSKKKAQNASLENYVHVDSNEEVAKRASAINFSIEDIDFIQGQHNLNLWKLKAQWGRVRKEDGIIIVEQPKLRYFMSEPSVESNDVLYVTANSGEIDQNDDTIRFLTNVQIAYQDKKLQGPTLIYSSKNASMTLSEPSEFATNTLSGSADTIIWNMNDKKIEALGNVIIQFNKQQKNSENAFAE